MGKFLNFMSTFNESKGIIIYHGLDEEYQGLKDIVTGMWFGVDLNNPIMDYYISRSKHGVLTAKFSPRYRTLDLTSYDVNENLLLRDLDDFVRDILYHNDEYVDEAVWGIEEEIEPRYDEEEEEYYTHSEVLNWIIERIVIKNRLELSSITILESGIETMVVFYKEDLYDIEIISET